MKDGLGMDGPGMDGPEHTVQGQQCYRNEHRV